MLSKKRKLIKKRSAKELLMKKLMMMSLIMKKKTFMVESASMPGYSCKKASAILVKLSSSNHPLAENT